jgi:hypothetical protein
MREGRICVGAHDLEDFRGLRLYKHDGTYLHEDDNIRVAQIWELQYHPKPNLEPPHLEDVLVGREGARLVGTEANLAGLVRQRDTVWATPEDLFEGRLRFTDAGSAYVPADGALPTRSTGYWMLNAPLERLQNDNGTRYTISGSDLRGVRYVGLEPPRATIPRGTLVRVSLSRRFSPTEAHNGYWLQLSGWY